MSAFLDPPVDLDTATDTLRSFHRVTADIYCEYSIGSAIMRQSQISERGQFRQSPRSIRLFVTVR